MITIKRARQVVPLCTDLSLYEAYHAAAEAFEKAKAEKPLVETETGNAALREAAEHMQALEDEMRIATLKFTLEAVDRLRWNGFVAEHPPREDNEIDAQQGVNVEALDELMPESIKAVHDADGKPYDFDPKAEWPALSKELSDGQWSDFVSALFVVNRGSKAPKSLAASLAMRSSEKS